MTDAQRGWAVAQAHCWCCCVKNLSVIRAVLLTYEHRIFEHLGEDGWKANANTIPHPHIHTGCSRWLKPASDVYRRKPLPEWLLMNVGMNRWRKSCSQATLRYDERQLRGKDVLTLHSYLEGKMKPTTFFFLHLRFFLMQLQKFTYTKTFNQKIHFWKYNRANITVSEILLKGSKWSVQFK